MWGGGAGVVGYVVYWRCLKGVVVRLMSCNAHLKASRLLWVKTLGRSMFHFWGKKAVFIIVVRGGYLCVFVWVVGSCLAVSGYEVLVGIDVYKIVGYFIHGAKSGLSLRLF